ncbi:hypothetical protein JXD38_11310 [candidate division WOR-3 bacterium]|nr:hypothetical protein [candidate division WOR-3 bacterium]
MTSRLMVFGLGLALLLACGRQVPADYFPLKAGQQRTMRVYTQVVRGADTTETTEVRIVEVVHGFKEVPGMGKCWVVESPRDSGRPAYSFFRKGDDGIIQLMPTNADKPPAEILYLALPLVKGLKWYDTQAQGEVMEVVAQETVRVDAGTFPDCYAVAVKSTRTGWSMIQWLAPEVGAVKWENRAVWTDKNGKRCELLKLAELVAFKVPHDSTE